MSENVYKKIEVVGTSKESFAEATRNAVARASSTLHGMSWFEVVEQRGRIGAKGEVEEFQVTLKIGLKLD